MLYLSILLLSLGNFLWRYSKIRLKYDRLLPSIYKFIDSAIFKLLEIPF